MYWLIYDLNRRYIHFTNGMQSHYVPKFRILLDEGERIPYDNDFVYITWTDEETGTGGERRKIKIDYQDVAMGYSGYMNGASSNAQLAEAIEAMIDTAWTDISFTLFTDSYLDYSTGTLNLANKSRAAINLFNYQNLS